MGTIFINKHLQVLVYFQQQIQPASYKHIVPDNNISLLSQVTNLIAFVKNFKKPENSASSLITSITELIEEYMEMNDCDESRRRLCRFILEQLNLMMKNKHQRRYSVDLLLIKTLKKITINLDKRTGIDDSTYLQMRFSKLNAFDRNILLMIDEIYLSKRIEASGGQIFGVTDGCEVAATAFIVLYDQVSYEWL